MVANLITFLVLMVATETAGRSDRETIRRDYLVDLGEHLRSAFDLRGRIRLKNLLDGSEVRRFEDVILAQTPVVGVSGRLEVEGVFLNPTGRRQRGVDFDEQRALEMISTAVSIGSLVDGPDGYAVPIGFPGERPWGGAWFRAKPVQVGAFPTLTLIWTFLLTLAVVTLATLVLLRRGVLDPVEDLAAAARRLEAGDLGARASIGAGRTDELGDLASGFNDMAARLQRYNAELEEAVTEATDRVRSAEAAAMTQRRLAATGELAAGIAHELNNPLGGLVNAVERLKRGDLPEGRREEYLDLVSGGLHRMGETVGRLLRLSPREASLDDVDMARPLGDSLGLVRHRAERASVTLEVSGPGAHGCRDPFGRGGMDPFETLPRVRGAANELGQAILNLLVNAIDAIQEGRSTGHPGQGPGRIAVHMDGIGSGDGDAIDGIRIIVDDDGPGVTDDVLGKAADAFFTTKEQGKGTGLGLAIVHNVVAAHGGRVLLEAKAGFGFRVTVELPLEPDPRAESDPETDRAQSRTQP